MRTAIVIFLALSVIFTIGGLFPCLGWINWIGMPCSAVCALLGLIGTLSKETPEADKSLHLGALIGGVCLLGIGGVRCFLGGGVV